MLLTEARRPARTRPDGALVPLDEQDRSLWDRDLIAEGVALITRTLPVGPVGPYQVQAAIAAVHDEAARAEDTDWPQVLALYGVLERMAPNPMVTLNRAVALAMVDGAGGGPRPARHARRRPPDGPAPPAPHGPRPPARTGRRHGRRPGRLPDGGPAHHQPPRTAAPGDARRPSGGGPAPPATASN